MRKIAVIGTPRIDWDRKLRDASRAEARVLISEEEKEKQLTLALIKRDIRMRAGR